MTIVVINGEFMVSPGELDSPLEGSDSEIGSAEVITGAQNWQDDSAM